MKYLARFGAIVLVLLACAAFYVYYGLTHRAEIKDYDKYKTFTKADRASGVTATFLGVSTLLFDDGQNAILLDGFFTRPRAFQLILEDITPEKTVIAGNLRRAGITRLDAVIVNHSHYDHAMDAPEVAAQTGAKLVGSDSTRNVGLGWGLPESQIEVRRAGDVMNFGRFRVTLLASGHVPSWFTGGTITKPLKPPARAKAYYEGESFAVLIEHGDKRMLVNASAGFATDATKGRKADVVFLGVGQLGKQPTSYMESYWKAIVETPGARRFIPIHWDDFTRSLDQPLVLFPNLIDNFPATMAFFEKRGQTPSVDLKLPEAFVPFDPFENLPPAKN